jgi:hypothetical protein
MLALVVALRALAREIVHSMYCTSRASSSGRQPST